MCTWYKTLLCGIYLIIYLATRAELSNLLQWEKLNRGVQAGEDKAAEIRSEMEIYI